MEILVQEVAMVNWPFVLIFVIVAGGAVIYLSAIAIAINRGR